MATKNLKKKPTGGPNKSPHVIRFCKSQEEIELEEILANGLPSHGSLRRDARNTVIGRGVSLSLVSQLISNATRKPVGIKQLTQVLRREGVPFIKIDFDDPLIREPDAADIERMKRPGILGKSVDVYEIMKYFPALLHGAVTGDVFMPPRGMEILEGVAAYAAVKRSRNWNRWKRSKNSWD